MSVLGFNSAFTKQPNEIITIKAEFNDVASSLVVSGYALNSSSNLTIYDSTGTSTGNNMISGNPTVDANNHAILATIKAGNDGENYYGRFLTVWSANAEPDQTIERDLLIKVRQSGK